MSWASNKTYNRLKSTYIKDILDISGSLILRKNTDILIETGNTYNTTGLRSQSNNFISSFQSYKVLNDKYTSDLLTLSSSIKKIC